MHFKLEYTIKDLILKEDQVLTYNVENNRAIRVEIRGLTPEEKEKGHKHSDAYCTVYTERKVSDKNEVVFQQIESNTILTEGEKAYQIYKGPNKEDISLPHVSDLPESFTMFLGQTHNEMDDAIKQTVGMIRWRKGILGPHNPVSSRGLAWSRDKNNWHIAPRQLKMHLLSVNKTAHISSEMNHDIESLISANIKEPVHHELFREAWGQRIHNSRSAMVTGLAALEVGMKSTIAALIDNTEWLVENIPSPPTVKMLEEYLPKLPVKNHINGKVVTLPKSMITTLKNAVIKRNQIAHLGKEAPTNDKLDEILNLIQDTLWLLDFYSGYDWAYEHISQSTRNALEAQT